jgi:hypothetical protein
VDPLYTNTPTLTVEKRGTGADRYARDQDNGCPL